MPNGKKLDDLKDVILFDEVKWQQKTLSDRVRKKDREQEFNINKQSPECKFFLASDFLVPELLAQHCFNQKFHFYSNNIKLILHKTHKHKLFKQAYSYCPMTRNSPVFNYGVKEQSIKSPNARLLLRGSLSHSEWNSDIPWMLCTRNWDLRVYVVYYIIYMSFSQIQTYKGRTLMRDYQELCGRNTQSQRCTSELGEMSQLFRVFIVIVLQGPAYLLTNIGLCIKLRSSI